MASRHKPIRPPIRPNGRLTIDLGAISANWRKLAGKASPCRSAAVVKADAYGLGAEPVVRHLAKAGCDTFFVATLDEAIAVRSAASNAAIHCFDGFHPAAESVYRKHAITPVINTPEQVKAWCAKPRRAMQAGLHVDTGINRLGLSADELTWLVASPDLMKRLDPCMVMSHFACADEPGDPMNDAQISRFRAAAAHFPRAIRSLANSAGIFLGRKAHFDLLRPGIALYGGEAVNDMKNPMKPVVRLEARILQIRQARAGESVGYGATVRLARDTRIAIIGAGYADGLHRAASGSGTPLRKHGINEGGGAMIGRHRAPFLGRISMDITCVDLTDLPQRALARLQVQADAGDGWVDLLNASRNVDELARAAGTIGYEILTGLGRRYERNYLNG